MITENEFKVAADLIGCEINVIKAVYYVEAAGRGYLPDKRVKILFEGHRFWKNLQKAGADPQAFIKANPGYSNVLYKFWDKKQYKGGAFEWMRMSLAIEVCNKLGVPTECAMDSASYGSFQILGENSVACGYATAHEMIAAYNNGGEAEQLNSFVRFVKATGLDDELRAKNWAAFAKGYNGTAFRLNKYDTKLANQYLKYSR